MAFQGILPSSKMNSKKVLHGVGHQDANKTITADSALRYAHRVIARVNKEEDNAGGQKRKTTTGIIVVVTR